MIPVLVHFLAKNGDASFEEKDGMNVMHIGNPEAVRRYSADSPVYACNSRGMNAEAVASR